MFITIEYILYYSTFHVGCLPPSTSRCPLRVRLVSSPIPSPCLLIVLLATYLLMFLFRHTSPMTSSCVSLVPTVHSLTGPVPYTRLLSGNQFKVCLTHLSKNPKLESFRREKESFKSAITPIEDFVWISSFEEGSHWNHTPSAKNYYSTNIKVTCSVKIYF